MPLIKLQQLVFKILYYDKKQTVCSTLIAATETENRTTLGLLVLVAVTRKNTMGKSEVAALCDII